MKNYDVVVSGYASLDRVIKVDKEPKAGFTSIIQNASNSEIEYGGCSTNIAYLLARLGQKSLPVIRVGKMDYEKTGFVNFLYKGGVITDAIDFIDNESTSNCYLIEDINKKHITLFYKGAMDEKYSKPLKDEYFINSKYGILTVGSYEDNTEFFKRCITNKTPLIFGMKSDYEAFPKDFLKDVLKFSSIIFMNEGEEIEIKKIFAIKNIIDLFNSSTNLITIVVTKGKDGSSFYERSGYKIERGDVAAFEVGIPIDTSGCGDAYMAGFIYGLLKNMRVKKCCEYGSILSSFVIEKTGCLTNAPSEDKYIKRCDKLI